MFKIYEELCLALYDFLCELQPKHAKSAGYRASVTMATPVGMILMPLIYRIVPDGGYKKMICIAVGATPIVLYSHRLETIIERVAEDWQHRRFFNDMAAIEEWRGTWRSRLVGFWFSVFATFLFLMVAI